MVNFILGFNLGDALALAGTVVLSICIHAIQESSGSEAPAGKWIPKDFKAI